VTGASPGSARPLGPLTLARLLIGLRLRLLRNRLRGGPQVGTARLAAGISLLVPLAYLGLFASAFEILGLAGGVAAQSGALVLVCSAIALSSCALKIASREAVGAAGGESEFLMARPVSLPALVLARGLAGVATDLYDAFFLLPILAAAALAWRLGPPALLLSALASVLVQLAVSALSQAAQILLVRVVPPAARRLAGMACALTAALAMAALWMGGSAVLRAPEETAQWLLRHRSALSWLPGALIAAPLTSWRDGGGPAAVAAVLALAAISVGALGLAWWLARRFSRGGWEQADAPWVHQPPADRGGDRGGGHGAGGLSLPGKDWRLFSRDRARLMAFLAMPALFVGMQVFGSAGWGWLRADPARLALLAYSLAAYAATFGPLQHMGTEGRAFWILRSVPLSPARLLGAKAAFWTALVGGLAALIFVLLALLAGVSPGRTTAGLAALVVVGAAVVSFLAVGLAAEVADLSDERRPAVGIGTTYLFMLVAGLFNVAILQPGSDRPRALLLYALAAVAAWSSGVARAAVLFDPEATTRRQLSPTVGALAAVLLFLGERAARAAATTLGAPTALWGQLPWLVAVGGGLWLYWRRNRAPAPAAGGLRALAWAFALGLLPGLAAAAWIGPAWTGLTWPAALLALRALVEELALRGVFQAGLARQWLGGAARSLPIVASALAAWAVNPAPLSAWGALAAIVPAVTMGLTQRLWAALMTRCLLQGLATGPALVDTFFDAP
jgi:hypothetical protein